MGPGRSLPELLQRYADANQNELITGSLATLKSWSMRFKWSERATAYDANWDARKTAEREAMMNYGLALDYERLRKLYRLAAMLEAQIYERGLDGVLHNIWVRDVKAVGSGEFAERVDIEKFNSPLLEQYRSVLADIAKETGGRVQRQENVNIDVKLIGQLERAVEARGLKLSDLVEQLLQEMQNAESTNPVS